MSTRPPCTAAEDVPDITQHEGTSVWAGVLSRILLRQAQLGVSLTVTYAGAVHTDTAQDPSRLQDEILLMTKVFQVLRSSLYFNVLYDKSL